MKIKIITKEFDGMFFFIGIFLIIFSIFNLIRYPYKFGLDLSKILIGVCLIRLSFITSQNRRKEKSK